MIKKMGIIGLTGMLFVFFLVFGLRQGFAEAPDVDTILKKMKEVFEPAATTTRMVTFTLRDKDGLPTQWIAQEARKELPNGKRSLLVMIEPTQVAGTARLISEQEGRTTAMFLYIPATNRIRKLYPIHAHDTFLNTDFTFSDLGFVDIRGENRVLGKEQFKGTLTYRVETKPKDSWYYSRIETWIDSETYLPVQRDFYDRAERLWKTMYFENVLTIDGIPTPTVVRMVDHENGTSTEYKTSDVCYGTNVPDEVFKLSELPNALSAAFCRIPPINE